MPWRDWFWWAEVEIIVPVLAVAIFGGQCVVWLAEPESRPLRPREQTLPDERERRELTLYLAQQTVLMQHAHDVAEWCAWVDREPALDEPPETWERWLDEALPIYLFTFGSPSICDHLESKMLEK